MGIIVVVSCAVVLLGGLWLGLLIVEWWRLRAHDRLAIYRSKRVGFADLLPYATMVTPTVVLHKSGAMSAAWKYIAPDSAILTDVAYSQVSARLNQALLPLGAGWMLHFDVLRETTSTPASALGDFPDGLTRAIEAERQQAFGERGALYGSTNILTVTWFPPVLLERKFLGLFLDVKEAPEGENHTQDLVAKFERSLSGLEDRLSHVFRLHRLGATTTQISGQPVEVNELLRHLNQCATGRDHPLRYEHIYLDALLGAEDLWTGLTPRLGNNYLQVVAIDGFPATSTPGVLQILAELPCAYRWSTRFIPLDEQEALGLFQQYRRKWRLQVRGLADQILNLSTSAVNTHAVQMLEEAEAAMGEIHGGQIAYGFYTSVVVLRGPDIDRLAEHARYVSKEISRLGFSTRIENANTLEAYLGSLPGEGHANVRRPVINTLNLADLLPTSTIWQGEKTAPSPLYPAESPPLMQVVARGSTPFWLNLHVSDVGHTLMFGPTGSGKSTHLAFIAAQLRRYPGMRIFVFDKGRSMYPLVAGIHAASQGREGRHFAIAAEASSLAFCPLGDLSADDSMTWALEWLEALMGLSGVAVPPERRNRLTEAVRSLQHTGGGTLSDFLLAVQDAEVRAALEVYTVDGPMGHLLDAKTDGLDMSDFTVFEVEDLLNLGDRYALPVLLYIFRRIRTALQGQPATIILDEAWVMLGHEVFRGKIREWLKVLRKENCSVVMATQSLSDATGSGILDVLLESCPTRIFLPNPQATDTMDVYTRMGLVRHQVLTLASAEPKRDYYYTSPSGSRLYQLALGPLALALTGSSDRASVEKIKRMEAEMGHAWLKHWLEQRQLPGLSA